MREASRYSALYRGPMTNIDLLTKPSLHPQDRRADAIFALGQVLRDAGYRFVAPTPLTYSRVLARARTDVANPLVEAFGWNRPFLPDDLDSPYRELLASGGLLTPAADGQQRSQVRFSSLGDLLFAHSGFPTDEPDAVFFGPDTYRFARAIQGLRDQDPAFSPQTIIDIGAGTGAGGIFAARTFPGSCRTILSDINRKALQFADINARLNGAVAETCQSDVLTGVAAAGDLIISNPPYLIDPTARAYRHGGGPWGCTLAVRILQEALGKLAPNGRLLLYTGTPIVRGTDMFFEAARPLLERRVKSFRYEEQDPDVFGEELEKPPYDEADRIATVVLHVKAADITR
jgi:SAM-dependent methyltransferase